MIALARARTCDQESFTYSPQTVHTTKFSLSITSTIEATPTTALPNEALDKLYTESIEKRRGIRRNSAHYGWLYKSQALGRLREMYQVETRILSADSSPHKILLDSECNAESFLYVGVQNKGDRDRITSFCSSHFLGSDGMIFDAENIKDPDRKISGKALSPSEVWQSN